MQNVSMWRQGTDRVARFMPPFELDPKKTALTIIDMQYLDAHPDYGLGAYLKKELPQAHAYYFGRLSQVVVPAHKKLLEFFRTHGMRIVYLRVGPLLPDKSDLMPLRKERELGLVPGVPHYMSPAGSFEHKILEELAPHEGDLVLDKNSASAFNSTAIDQILRNMQIDCLVITGVVTWACVLATALDAADKGYRCVMVEDAVAGRDEELHKAALRIFNQTFGRVETSNAVCAEIERRLSALA